MSNEEPRTPRDCDQGPVEPLPESRDYIGWLVAAAAVVGIACAILVDFMVLTTVPALEPFDDEYQSPARDPVVLALAAFALVAVVTGLGIRLSRSGRVRSLCLGVLVGWGLWSVAFLVACYPLLAQLPGGPSA